MPLWKPSPKIYAESVRRDCNESHQSHLLPRGAGCVPGCPAGAALPGAGNLPQLRRIKHRFSKKHIQRVLIVTDEGIVRSGIAGQLETALDECGVCYTVFSETRPNPTVDNVEAALRLYRRDNCQALIAIGGGSSMDCAKAVGARIARPKPRWASSRAPCASFISCPPSSPSPPPPEPAAKPLWRR